MRPPCGSRTRTDNACRRATSCASRPATRRFCRCCARRAAPPSKCPLPWVWPLNPKAHAPAMYRSTYHWQPLLNGYGSYWPDGFVERMRLAVRLPDPAAVRALRRETGLEFILARVHDHLPIDEDLAKERAAWLDLVQRGGRPDLRLVAADDSLALFRVTDERAGSDVTTTP